MTEVAEIIRRDALQREFTVWIKSHIDKCSKFISEENRIRSDFYNKLEKHFLRQIFTGLGDVMPDFAPTPPKIDLQLPKVDIAHLKELRNVLS